MDKAIKFLGISLLISAIIFSTALVIYGYFNRQVKNESRYEFNGNPVISVFDKQTGNVYVLHSIGGQINIKEDFEKFTIGDK